MFALFIFCVVTYIIYAIGDVGMDYVWGKISQKNLSTTTSYRDIRQGLDQTRAEFVENKLVTLFVVMSMLANVLAYIAAWWALFEIMYPKHKVVFDWVKSVLAPYF